MMSATTVKDHLIDSLLRAGKYNRFEQIQPAAILWPDKNRGWEPVIPLLQRDLPELLVCGQYQPDQKSGPSIWLKCMIARMLPEAQWAEDRVPIIYLPGISRSELRAIEDCPWELQSLAELQYRGVFWVQHNSKDWTVLAFVKSTHNGLGLDMAGDKSTVQAAQRSLRALLMTEVDSLQGRRLESDDFDALLIQDPIQELLVWLNDPQTGQGHEDPRHWETFCEHCRKELGFHPEQDGPLAAAEKLIQAKGKWRQVWERFQQSWRKYPQIPALLERTQKPYGLPGLSNHPAENKEAEDTLRKELLAFANRSQDEAIKAITKLENQHGHRRKWLWAEMGRSPLAESIGYLKSMVDIMHEPFGGFEAQDMAKRYAESLWQADGMAIQAYAAVQHATDQDTVEAVLQSAYLSWLKGLNELFQDLVKERGYPRNVAAHEEQSEYGKEGECWLFVDGLRLDVAYRLQEHLGQSGLGTTMSTRWTALPSVTATGKVAVSPVAHLATGVAESKDFEPIKAQDRSQLDNTRFRRLLRENGWQVLDHSDLGDPSGRGWTEAGDLDHFGHHNGRRLARDIPNQIQFISETVHQLLDAGWKRVRVVTDHGWLFLPGGLPKAELSSHLTETIWGRCAVLKNTATPTGLTLSWTFCPDVLIAMAPGVSSFIANRMYAHGGLSLQECLVPEIIVQNMASSMDSQVQIHEMRWQGLRCKLTLTRASSHMAVDIRTKANAAETSVLDTPKQCEQEKMSVLVTDDEYEGQAAFVVLVDAHGQVLARKNTVIGGDEHGA
jgi:hypothetical protein